MYEFGVLFHNFVAIFAKMRLSNEIIASVRMILIVECHRVFTNILTNMLIYARVQLVNNGVNINMI